MIIINFENRTIGGKCKAKDFKQNFQELKDMVDENGMPKEI